jgi:hypothetical protein
MPQVLETVASIPSDGVPRQVDAAEPERHESGFAEVVNRALGITSHP